MPSEAGWYPDPVRPGRERLWDGDAWLDWSRRQEDGRVEDDPAGWRSDPGNPSFERLWAGNQWTDSKRPAGTGGVVVATPSPSAPPARALRYPSLGTRWVILGYVAALVVPVVGMVIGVFQLRPRGSVHWLAVTILGAGMNVIWLLAFGFVPGFNEH